MLEIVSPGMLATLQDSGRYGVHALGIGTAGAMDTLAARVANMLLGNAERAAVLELTAGGVELRAQGEIHVALCGADLEATVDGVALPLCAPVRLSAGAVLRLGRALRGWRAYLAVRGGFDADAVFGSVATDLRGGFGGHGGRALRRGDCLETASAPPPASPRRPFATALAHPAWRRDGPLGLVVEPARNTREDAGLAEVLETGFTVSREADRMGLRLDPPLAVAAGLQQQVSAAVAFGAVQLPPDGKAIILGADRQTTGGYPLAGVVAGIDHWRIAQARPGDTLRFRQVDADTARRAWRAREQQLARLRLAVAAAWRDG